MKGTLNGGARDGELSAINSEDEAAVEVLRTSGSIAILFLLAYLAYDLRGQGGKMTPAALYHWITVVGALLFFAATWTSNFRRHWRLWNMLFAVGMLLVLILISPHTRDGDSRYIAVLLIPVATASFVNWGWPWQATLCLACLGLYALAQKLVPLPGAASFYRWLGLAAAVTISLFTSVFLARYRTRLQAQLEQLREAAAFRESQIATMAHDIRSPVAALSGFASLLEEEQLSESEQRELLARLGSTAWNMDLTVINVLDLYQMQEGQLTGAPVRLDPHAAIAEAAESCALQAERKGLKLTADYGAVVPGNFDSRHLERVVRNLLAYSIGRLQSGEITLKTHPRNEGIAIEVADDGPVPAPEERQRLFAASAKEGASMRSPALGLYIARAIVESDGGRLRMAVGERAGAGIRMIAEIPSAELPTKTHR